MNRKVRTLRPSFAMKYRPRGTVSAPALCLQHALEGSLRDFKLVKLLEHLGVPAESIPLQSKSDRSSGSSRPPSPANFKHWSSRSLWWLKQGWISSISFGQVLEAGSRELSE